MSRVMTVLVQKEDGKRGLEVTVNSGDVSICVRKF